MSRSETAQEAAENALWWLKLQLAVSEMSAEQIGEALSKDDCPEVLIKLLREERTKREKRYLREQG